MRTKTPRLSSKNPSKLHSQQVTDLLFEIGTEELPAAYLPGLIEQLGAEAKALLAAHHLAFKQVESFGTSRRLVLLVRGLSGVQRKPSEKIRGPSKQAAFDAEGKPTPALLGFLRSRGGSLRQVKVDSPRYRTLSLFDPSRGGQHEIRRVSPKLGEHVYLVKPPTETPTTKILPELLPQLVGKLRAPKTMRWDDSGVRFARPIRWVLARYGNTPIRCALGDLTSASRTRIGRPQAMREVRVASIPRYFQTLTRAGILLDPAKRQRWIQQEVEREARRVGGVIAPEMVSHGLLEEVTHLVESPVLRAGAFDQTYLELPREVLLASMAKHQRVFAVESSLPQLIVERGSMMGSPQRRLTVDSRGALLPCYVAILEGKPKKPAAVQEMIKRILNARLADSLLFWQTDLTQPLDALAARAANITFHEKLGSMQDKVNRLTQMSRDLAAMWSLTEEEADHLRHACQWAKADLASTMVREFPTLQGVMGKYYVHKTYKDCRDQEREKWESVAMAIEEHYLPLGGKTPKTLLGRALGILDKYDTLASYFGIGIEPTGDQDPFGLRRAAQGIVEVADAAARPVLFHALLKARAAFPPFTGLAKDKVAAIGERLRRYVLERLYSFPWPQLSSPTNDIIDAVLASRSDDLVDVMERVRSLARMNGEAGLRKTLHKAAKVIERTRNILKSATIRQPEVDPGRLSEEPERKLWNVYEQHRGKIDRLREERLYEKATEEFGRAFFEPLHEFFDRVLVNTPEESLQQNRLALMQAINTLYTDRIADLSKLIILQHKDDSSD